MIFAQARRNAAKLIGERSLSFDLARGRLVFLGIIFSLAYVIVAARAVDLTIIQGRPHEITAAETSETIAPPAKVTSRGEILDRNGVLLATTLKMASLYADPHLVYDKKATAEALVKIFPELTQDDLLKKLQSEKRFIRIRRDLRPGDEEKVLMIGEPGLAFQDEDRRVYPQGALAAHLVGYSSVDNVGLAGIERGFNEQLDKGETVNLTLDVRLQHVLRREILKAMKDFNAIGGAGVIMDANNGEVLAGVSLPDFDPRVAGSASKDTIFNRLTLGTYELGSVFKIFSIAGYIDSFNPPMNATFDASKPIKAGGFTISDYHAENRVMTIPEIFMHSSNIGAAMMGQKIGGEKLKGFYEDLGLLNPLDIEIQEIGKPHPGPAKWGESATVTASFGHGISTTPLQVAAATASIVNGGNLVRPSVVMNDNAKETGIHVVSEKTAHRIRQLMRLVVTDGTGGNADVPGYDVGGKTGTAEKSARGGYDRKRLISSFIGAFPIDAPRYVVYVMIDEPKPNKQSFGYATGGWTAAPAVGRIIASSAAILGLPAERTSAQQDMAASLKQYVSAGAHD